MLTVLRWGLHRLLSAPMKLLLVEDSDRLRGTLSRGLAAAGFTVDTAADGVEALSFLAAYEYELIVLDLMLPRLDGLGVLKELPRGGQRPGVIVLSARDAVGVRIQARVSTVRESKSPRRIGAESTFTGVISIF